jgi:flagellar basal-body rod protein FlgB
MNPFSTTLLIKALDGLSARQIATAQNIANASSVNYRPMRISFERALAAAARSGDRATVEAVKPALLPDPEGAADGQTRIDLELGTASATAMRYAALIDILNRQIQLDAIAVRGNS